MSKWDGWMEVPLDASQVKQIAGRAGRYGMGMSMDGGVVTTLEPSDLPLLKAAMDTKPESLRYARVGFTSATIKDIFEALPQGSTATTAHDALLFCSVLPPSMAVMDPNAKEAEIMRFIDSFSQNLTFAERALLLQCPFPSLDNQCKVLIGRMLSKYRDNFSVDLRSILFDSGLLASLDRVLAAKQDNRALSKPRQDLAELETLHGLLTVYAWLSLRNSVAFHSYDLAVALRKATQEAMDHCLQSFSGSRRNRTLRLGAYPPKHSITKAGAIYH
jgi:ATP-dependent RNA helicase SUPV3L1/SUV3